MTTGERIRARRKELGLSQNELGRMVGYKSRSSINKLELDHRNLTPSKIKSISEALGTTPSYLMGWEKETPTSVSEDGRENEAMHYFKSLSDDRKNEALNYLRYLASSGDMK